MPYTNDNIQPSQTISTAHTQAMIVLAILEQQETATTRELMDHGILDPACDIEMLRLLGYDLSIEFITTTFSADLPLLINIIQYKLLSSDSSTKQEHIIMNLLMHFDSVSTDEFKMLGILCPSAVITRLRSEEVNIKAIYHRYTTEEQTSPHYRYKLQDNVATEGDAP